MVDLQTISVSLAALGVLVAATYYILTLRNQNRTRQTQLFMQIYSQWNSEEFARMRIEIRKMNYETFEEATEKYGFEVNPDSWIARHSLCRFYSGLGMLVHDGEIELSRVEDMMGDIIVTSWETLRTAIQGSREAFGWTELYLFFEYLYHLLKRNGPIIRETYPNREIILTNQTDS
jgi:hypothetical protein